MQLSKWTELGHKSYVFILKLHVEEHIQRKQKKKKEIYRRMCTVFKITKIKWKTRVDAIVFCFHIANAQLWLKWLQKQKFHCAWRHLCVLRNYPVSHGIASGRWICWWEYPKITNKMHLQCFCKKVLHSETFSFS